MQISRQVTKTKNGLRDIGSACYVTLPKKRKYGRQRRLPRYPQRQCLGKIDKLHTHTCMHACIHTYTHTYIHTYIHTHIIHSAIHYYIYTHIHTYTHTCLLFTGLHCYRFQTNKRTLRSNSKNILQIPHTNLKRFGDRAFCAYAPRLRNDLPDNIKAADSVQNFKKQLKTLLLRKEFI